MKKVIIYILCFILILGGVFCSIKLYQQITKESYINGSIDIENEFRKESFLYSSTAVTIYPTGTGSNYSYEKELVPVDGIDLNEKDYTFYFNDYEVIDAEMKGGQITAPINIKFYNSDGSLACDGNLTIKIEFLSSGTKLTLVCPNENSATYFEQYFLDYGIKLKLVENLGEK